VSRLPDPGSEFDAEGIPDPGDAEGDQVVTGDVEGRLIAPRDHAIAADDFGTTAAEERDGESLDGRLAREQPDVLTDESVNETVLGDDLDTPYHPAESVGQIVEDSEGAGPDVTAEQVGHEVPVGGAESAEEAAMHVVPGEG
jgi:hypothetical protein